MKVVNLITFSGQIFPLILKTLIICIEISPEHILTAAWVLHELSCTTSQALAPLISPCKHRPRTSPAVPSAWGCVLTPPPPRLADSSLPLPPFRSQSELHCLVMVHWTPPSSDPLLPPSAFPLQHSHCAMMWPFVALSLSREPDHELQDRAPRSVSLSTTPPALKQFLSPEHSINTYMDVQVELIGVSL